MTNDKESLLYCNMNTLYVIILQNYTFYINFLFFSQILYQLQSRLIYF